MKTKLSRAAFLVLLSALVFSFSASAADYIVIANKGNAVAADKAAVAKMFTGEMKSWGDGTPVVPADLAEDNPIRSSFSTEVLGKSVANMKAFWAQNVFSGKSLPPKQFANDEDVKKFVSATKGAIGYIKSSSLDDSIRVVIK